VLGKTVLSHLSGYHSRYLLLNCTNSISKKVFWGIFYGLLGVAAVAQEQTKEVEIIHADYLRYTEMNGKKYTILSGDVKLKQQDVFMFCDSAVIQRDSNWVDAFGHVHIRQDTIDAFSDVLVYSGNNKTARMQRNVKLLTPGMTLLSNELVYNTSTKTASYSTGGKIIRNESVITSQKGYFFSSTDLVHFKNNVVITDPNYQLNSDTLHYNMKTDVAYFLGKTKIINQHSTIECVNGWYDSKNDWASFGKGTVVNNPPQILFTDSLFYDRKRGWGRCYKNFEWRDSSMEVSITARYGEYFDERQYIVATLHPVLIYKMEDDSLFLTADTLKSQTKSETDTTRVFFAYKHVRMFTKEMQGVCDSLFYSFEDSMFRFHYQPILWNDSIQMTADTIYLTVKNKKPNELKMLRNGFIISPAAFDFFDQIKGKNIYGYFLNNELHQVNVVQNAESLYFGKEDNGKILGANYAKSSVMRLYFANKKMQKIAFVKKPEAVFTPIKQLPADQYHLKDFKWQIQLRPPHREAILNP
jgi:lipopolysaccharide export system protein LptA